MQNNKVANRRNRLKDERGAALITVLMISIPLLMAGGSLILITSMSTANSADMAAETKAYYAAEAGAQQVLQVMRGRALGSVRDGSVGSIASANMITFKGGDPIRFNVSGDGLPPRLTLEKPRRNHNRVRSRRIIHRLMASVQRPDERSTTLTVTFSTTGAFQIIVA
jgi:hypothetical protein